MPEAFDKVRDARQLPIFPLPLVLMPGEVISLHLFEPRYRRMLEDIQAGNLLFGISFFDAVTDETARPDAGHTGCAAELREVQMLPDGRSNIVVQGVIRYTLDEYVETGTPYFTGEVSYFDDFADDDGSLEQLAGEVKSLFTRVADAAHKLSGERAGLPELPDIAPPELSFLIAAAFNFDNEIKLALLETRSTSARLEKLAALLKNAVEKVEETAEIHKVAGTNGHSKKKIDLD